MEFKVKKGIASMLCNTIRHVAMTQIKVLRPIAFKVNANSNVLTAEGISEDMLQFTSNLIALHFKLTKDANLNDSIFVQEYSFDEVLTSRDLSSGKVICIEEDENRELLHCLPGFKGHLSIYYRYTNGNHKDKDNIFSLNSELEATGVIDKPDDSYIFIASNHNDIKKLNFTINENDIVHDKVNMSIETYTNIDEKEILKHSIQEIKDIVDGINRYIV